MRRLNAKLLVILAIAVVGVGVVIQGLHAVQVGRQSSAFLREADRAEQADKPQEAAAFLQTYLRLVPEDTQAMQRLAMLLFRHRQFGEAQALFGQIILREQNNEEARRRLVETSIRSERYQDAQYHLGFLLKAHPEDGDLWLQLGAALQGLGQYQQAVEAYRTAIKKSPASIVAYEQAAQLLAERLGDAPAAVAVLDKMVEEKANHERAEAYITRAQFIQSHGEDRSVRDAILSARKVATGQDPAQRQKALDTVFAKDVTTALRLAPNSSGALLLSAQAALARGSAKEASKFAERASQQEPSNPECYLVLASINLYENQNREAAECLSRGLKATGGAPALLWTLANLRLEANEIQEAKTLVERLRPIEAARPIVRYLSARIRISESKWAEAARELDGVEAELKRWPQLYKDAQFRLAQCDSRLGRDDWAVGAYRAALGVDPDWAPARLGLAEALRALGRFDERNVELRRLQQQPNPPPHTGEELLRMDILKTLGLPPAQRNWSTIDAELSAIRKGPFTVDGALLAAEVELGKDQADAAARTLRAALEREPKDVRLWTALTSLAARQEQWDQTQHLLDEMKTRLGDSVALRLARAGYLMQRYGASRKDELRALAAVPSTFSTSDQLSLMLPLGRMAFAIQDYDQAQRLWQKVADADPANLQIRLLLLDLAWQREKFDDLAKPVAEIELLEQNGPYSHYAQALRSVGQAKRLNDDASLSDAPRLAKADALYDQAARQLDEARARFPSWSKIPLLAAQIADSRGKWDAALENYRSAFALGERSPIVISRLLSLLVDRQENDKIETVVRQLIDEKVPFSVELTGLVSQALVQMGDRGGAIALARKSAAASKDFRSMILLGQLLRVNGQPAEAEAELRRATSLAPKKVSPWLALIAFYSSGANRQLVEKTLEQALAAVGPEQAWEIQGYAYQSAGKLQEAEKIYDAALKADPRRFPIRKLAVETKLQNRRMAQAQSLLGAFLGSPDAANDAANAQWARRTLALSLASTGTYPKYRQALALVDKNLQAPSGSDADRRVRAIIQASFPTFESRNQALETLIGLAQRPNVLTPDDRIVMARLYLSRGEWVKSSQVFREVVARSREPRHIAAYVDALLGQKELAAADDWLRRLEALAPHDFATIDLRARLLAAQDRYPEAFDRIVGALRAEPAGKGPSVAQQRAASLRLEQLASELLRLKRDQEAARFFARAEALLTSGEGRAEGPSVDRLEFLIRRGRGPDALEEFDRLCTRAAPAELDQACMASTALSVGDRTSLERLERSLAQVTQRRPSYSAWVALAAIQDRLGDYEHEEASYRSALALDDGRRVDALNNLAYLLALQKKDLTEARALVGKAIDQVGPRTPLLDSRALVELAAGEPNAALVDLQIAVSDGANPTHLFHLACVHFKNGQVDKARTALRGALQGGLSTASLNSLELSALQELKAQLDVARG